MEEYITVQEFKKLMGITYVTALAWLKNDVIKNYQKKNYALGKYKYLIPRSEVERIKALRE